MKIETTVGGKTYWVDLAKSIDLSIPLIFNGPQPNTYDVPPASAKPYRDGVFIGDTRQGGSCNFDVYSLIPHCNATHTECVGHISLERIPLNARPLPGLIPATLISVQPIRAEESEKDAHHSSSKH